MDEDEMDDVVQAGKIIGDTLRDMADNGMLPFGNPDLRPPVEIRAKMDELLRRPTGLNDQIKYQLQGKVNALRWVLGELDEL